MPASQVLLCDEGTESSSSDADSDSTYDVSAELKLEAGVKGPKADDVAPLLSDVIENIGYGPGHLIQLILGGGVYISDGAEMMLIGSVARALAEDWDLGASAKGTIVSFVFIGVLFGNLLGGWIGDKHGRRLPILTSYLFVAFFSVISSMTPNFYMLAAVRFFVGLAFGIGVPAWNTLSSELVPMRWRDFNNGTSMALFSFGEAFAAVLIYISDPTMDHLDWRWLLMMGAIPSVFLTLGAAAFLVDSPYWLAFNGQRDKAKSTLMMLCRTNCRSGVKVDFRTGDTNVQTGSEGQSLMEQVSILCNPDFRVITAVLCFSCFVLNFVYYGCLYAFPQVFVDTSSSPAWDLVMGAVWELPGIVFGVVCSMFVGRKPMMLLYLTAMGVSLAAFAWTASQENRTGSVGLILNSAYFAIKIFTVSDFLVFYTYASEVYPTVARASGSAACIAAGRVGSISCPFLFEHLQELTGGFNVFFYIMAGCCALNALMIVALPETWGKDLSEEE